MPELPGLFASSGALGEAFAARLEAMLAEDLLGAFILVLANAHLDPTLGARLREPLRLRHADWQVRLGDGDASAAAPDDIAVFRQLPPGGLAALAPVRHRRVGPWELQFNPLRALRPPRVSDARVTRLSAPFDPAGFHFDRPFLRREALWAGDLAGVPVRLLYNKFPFVERHALLVPEPAAGYPQHLGRERHEWLWTAAATLGTRLPGLGIAYNAFGAYASVNHLHAQLFQRAAPLPIEAPYWRHCGGDRAYPLAVERFDDAAGAWARLERLHAAETTYNLLYRPGRVFVVARAFQGGYRHSDWTTGFAWAEVMGAVSTFDEGAFGRLGEAEIEGELGRLVG